MRCKESPTIGLDWPMIICASALLTTSCLLFCTVLSPPLRSLYLLALPSRPSSGLSYATVPIEGEGVDHNASTSGPSSSDPGFIPFHPVVVASSNPTTVFLSGSVVPPISEGQEETPSPFTAQEDELITMEPEDRLMREETERRMNAPGRSRPGGVHQGRFHLHKTVEPYPHTMALGDWSKQHAERFRKTRSIQSGGRRGQSFVVPRDRSDQADNSGRGGGPSGSAERIALLPAFDPSNTAGSSSGPGRDEQGSHRGSVGVGEPVESLMGLGGSGADHRRGGGPVLGAAESRCCQASV